MKDAKYLVACPGYEEYMFYDTREEAVEGAKNLISGDSGVEAYIYEVKFLGTAYIPDPGAIIEWED